MHVSADVFRPTNLLSCIAFSLQDGFDPNIVSDFVKPPSCCVSHVMQCNISRPALHPRLAVRCMERHNFLRLANMGWGEKLQIELKTLSGFSAYSRTHALPLTTNPARYLSCQICDVPSLTNCLGTTIKLPYPRSKQVTILEQHFCLQRTAMKYLKTAIILIALYTKFFVAASTCLPLTTDSSLCANPP
jgi:hypothetical protein